MFTPGEDSHFDSYFSTGWFNHQLDHRRCWPPARQKACLVPTAATAESLGLPGVVLTDKNHGMTVVISNILYFHPYLGKWSDLTDIFQMGWNHQLENYHQKTAGWNSEKMLRCILRKAAILMCACMWGMKHLWRRRGLKIDPLCHVVFFFHPYRPIFVFLSAFFFFCSSGREKLMSTTMDEMRSLGCTVTFYVSFKTLTLKKWGSVYFYPERCKKPQET